MASQNNQRECMNIVLNVQKKKAYQCSVYIAKTKKNKIKSIMSWNKLHQETKITNKNTKFPPK